MIILTNANLVLSDEIIKGTLCFEGSKIVSVDAGRSSLPAAIDCEGDFVMPGLVELHTDNVERHFMPRPGVYWPDHRAAALAHDSEIAAAGITTVFDSLCVGDYDGKNSPRRELFHDMVTAVSGNQAAGLFRSEHLLHLRCELSDPHLMETLEPVAAQYSASLVSLMDHTPGQRQWRDVDSLRLYMTRTGLSETEVEEAIQERVEKGSQHTPANWAAVLNLFEGRDVTLATHDDTTLADIDQGAEAGIKISEFPCSLEAATYAKKKGMSTIGGSPNIVRGGSHSGNVSISDLAQKGVLDALSSDYVPSSLLQAAFVLALQLDRPLYETLRTITSAPASMVGLTDRGALSAGKRADVLRVKQVERTPVIGHVYAKGRRVI